MNVPTNPLTALPSLSYAWTRRRLIVALTVAFATLVAVSQATDLALLADTGARFVGTPVLLLAFLGAYASAFFLRALAWTLLAPSLGLGNAFVILHTSLFANHVAPVKVGEVLRPLMAVKHGLSTADAVTTSVAARLFDVLSLVTIASILGPVGVALPHIPASGLIALPLATVGSTAVGLVWLRSGRALPWGPPRLKRIVAAFSDSLRSQPRSRLLGAAGVTLPSWVLEGTVVYVAAISLGVSVSAQAAVAATAFTLMFQMLHVTPGGIGVYEAAMTGALTAFGLSPSEALSVAVLAHSLKFAYSFTIALGLTLTTARVVGWSPRSLPTRHLSMLALLTIQVILVLGYFLADWPARAAFIVDVLLLVVSTAAVLGRQWLGTWRPLPVLVPAIDDPRPIVAVIPAFNEASTLRATLARIPRDVVQRIVVVDDGSSDATADIARSSGADLVVSHERNRGLGAALRTALDAAKPFTPKAVLYVDADGEYDPAEAARLLAPILSGDADYVLGSRYLGTRSGQLRSRKLGNALFTALLSFAAGRPISDGQTGFRAFSPRAVAVAEIVHDYNYAQVLTLDLLSKRMRMREVPITWSRRTSGDSFVGLEYLWRVPLGMLRELLASSQRG